MNSVSGSPDFRIDSEAGTLLSSGIATSGLTGNLLRYEFRLRSTSAFSWV